MNIESIYNLGSLINLALIILTVAASFYVLKKNVVKARDEIARQTAEAQRNAIEAMHEEIETLNRRVNEMRTQNIKLEHVITTICTALKGRGIIITIDGEMITILDNNSHSSTSARIQEEQAS